jgi:hypothetical protein
MIEPVTRCLSGEASPCDICFGQWHWMYVTEYFVVPCQYNYTIVPYLRSSTRCCYQKNKRAKPGDFPEIIALSETRNIR